jgi:hypothetical protein
MTGGSRLGNGEHAMRIIVVGYYNILESVPRANRVRELAREFVLRGYEVIVLCATGASLKREQNPDGFQVLTYGGGGVASGSGMKDHEQSRMTRFIPRWARSFVKKVAVYLVGELESRHIRAIAQALLKIGRTDMLISVGLPFAVHRGTERALNTGLRSAISIADCGDPYYDNPNRRLAPYHRWIERRTLSRFDAVTIPTEIARTSYEKAGVDPSRIRIIPQGFAMDVAMGEPVTRQPHAVVRCAYAGNLYPKIRNPKKILDHLMRQMVPLEFHFYLDMSNNENRACLEPYLSCSTKKLVVHEPLSREECLRDLRQYDFLVNFRNRSENQLPSKLIDYAMVGRPILDISCANPDLAVLDSFLNGDYSTAFQIDLARHDIRRVADQFLSLTAQKAHATHGD